MNINEHLKLPLCFIVNFYFNRIRIFGKVRGALTSIRTDVQNEISKFKSSI